MKMMTEKLDNQGAALVLLAQRQKVLAGNIANADTPGFQARDFDFSQALDAARAGRTGGTATTSGSHLATASAMAPSLQWRTPDQPSLDGNTVDLDRERAHFADNALRYEATLRFINDHTRTMLSAITGQ